MKYLSRHQIKKSAKRVVSSALAFVMTLSLILVDLPTADAATNIKDYLNQNIAGADGSLIQWQGAAECAKTVMSKTASTNYLMQDSDKDPTTDTGWHRLLICDLELENVLSGLVSGSGYTNAISYFTHPLGTSLRGAWISPDDDVNGDTLTMEGAVTSGVKGYNYVVPEGIVNATSIGGTNCVLYNTVNSSAGSDKAVKTGNTYDSWYIKYAGNDSSGKPKYYIAAEGKDGVKRLLVYVSDVVLNGDGSKAEIESRTVLVTAQDYVNNPDLYQKRYGWPTIGVTQGYDPATAHNQVGTITGSDGSTMRIVNQAYTECFSTNVTDACCWQFDISVAGNSYYTVHALTSCAQVEKFDKTKSMLYKAIQGSTASDAIRAQAEKVVALMGDSSDIYNSTNKKATANAFCLKKTSSGYKYLWTTNDKKVVYFYITLGEEVKQDTYISVKSGETMTISSAVTIPSGTELVVEEGGTLQVKSTLCVDGGRVNVKGTMVIESGGKVTNDSGYRCRIMINGGELVICDGGGIKMEPNGGGYVVLCNYATCKNNGLIEIPTGRLRVQDSYFDNLALGVVVIGAFSEVLGVDTALTLMRNAKTRWDIFGCIMYKELDKYIACEAKGYNDSPGEGDIWQTVCATSEWQTLLAERKNKGNSLDLYGFTGNRTSWNCGIMDGEAGYMWSNILYLAGYSTYRNNGRTYCFGGIYGGADQFIIGDNQILEFADFGYIATNATFQDYYNSKAWWGFCDGSNSSQIESVYGMTAYPYNLSLTWSTVECHVGYGNQVVDDTLAASANLTVAEYNAKYNSGSPYSPPPPPSSNDDDDGC